MPCTTQIFKGTTRRLPGGSETSPFSRLAAGPEVQYTNLVKLHNYNTFAYVTRGASVHVHHTQIYNVQSSEEYCLAVTKDRLRCNQVGCFKALITTKNTYSKKCPWARKIES